MTTPIDLRTLLAIILTLTLASFGLGRPLPFDTSAPLPFVASLALFFGCCYLLRTLVRLPFAIVITLRRTRYARQQYGLGSRESLRDGFARGFLDNRRWTVGPLALIDRLAVFAITLLTTTPFLGQLLVSLGGMIGIGLLLILYLFRGSFSFLVDDNLRETTSAVLPFLKTRD
jgi:hypothetical protein